MKTKNLAIGSGLLSAGIIAGSIFAPLGFAGAQEDTPETDPQTDVPDADAPGSEAPELAHRRGPRGHKGLVGDAVSEILGLTTDELRAALQEGKTLVEIAAEQGISETDLVRKLVEQASAKLDELVASGDITSEMAAEKKAGLEERISNAVNADPADRHRHGHRGRVGAHLETLGEILGLSTEEIRDGFEAGKSIADMAAEEGIELGSLVDQLVADATERVEAALADGKIDADRAAEITDGLKERITERVTADPSERPQRGDRRGHSHPPASDADSTETGLDA